MQRLPSTHAGRRQQATTTRDDDLLRRSATDALTFFRGGVRHNPTRMKILFHA
jgi:hypothetical protein